MTNTNRTDHYKPRQRPTEDTLVDDVLDESYKEKEGSMPARQVVWRNVILMGLLHLGALYGLTIIMSASAPTLLWSKSDSIDYSTHTHHYVLNLNLHTVVILNEP